MPKRTGGDSLTPPNPKEKNKEQEQDGSDLEFEDPYVDEYDEEEIIEEDLPSDEELPEGQYVEDEEEMTTEKKVWRPGIDPIAPYEVLDYDSSAYDMMFPLNVEWPCLSFDIIKDNWGMNRNTYPQKMMFVAGTQAASQDQNKIFILKLSDLHKTRHDDESSDDEENEDDDEEEEDDDDDGQDDDPVVESKWVKHRGAVNRIRVMPQCPNIVASWSDAKKVHIWDLAGHIQSLQPEGEATTEVPLNNEPLYTYIGHNAEGFSMDWSPLTQGRLLTGDCNNKIMLWNSGATQTWTVEDTPFKGHTGSVEDLQWSPSENNVFASCSVDKTVRIWDIRMRQKSALSVVAHDSDVNVISWNHLVQYLLVSGSDDHSIKIWDLRKFNTGKPAAHFNWHQDGITSVEWHPTDESVLAASSDNHLTIWDLSVEEDQESAQQSEELAVPPQLLFLHQGQQEIKELHWHKQIPGAIVSTAVSGFNVFKTCNM